MCYDSDMARERTKAPGAFSLRIPPDLRAALELAASEDVRTLHGEILYLLRLALRERGAGDKESVRESSVDPQ
jgi:hypothetical protein